jgi:pyocin large subunit-like protein
MNTRTTLLILGLLFSLVVGTACRKTIDRSPAQSPAPAARPIGAPATTLHREIGFASRRKLQEHFEKHGREFGSVSEAEYLGLAQTLRDRSAGGDVLEIIRRDGVITRFDRSSGAFLAFNDDRTIRTFFKPNDGENYFRRQSKR